LEKSLCWTFAALSTNDIQRLASAVGFWYRWDDTRQQFDHPAMLVAIDRGRVARLLVGGEVSSVRLQEALDQLQGKLVFIYPLPGKVMFRCFDYDAGGRFRIHGGVLILILPGVMAFGATLLIFRWRNRRA